MRKTDHWLFARPRNRDRGEGLCRKHGFSEASYYLWKSKFGGMSVPDVKRLKGLDTENDRLRNCWLSRFLRMKSLARRYEKNGDRSGEARADTVRRAQGLTEHRALRMAGMSSSVLRYQRRDDGN